MGRKGAFTKDPAGPLDELPERKPQRDQGPEHGLKMDHQHRCRNSLACDIAQDKVEAAAFRPDQVTIVSTDNAGGFIMISHLPNAGTEIRIWEETFLYSGRQFKVDFQSPLLIRREMVKAETGEGIGDQPFSLDGLVANFAEAVGSGIHAGQSGIDLMDKIPDLRAFSSDRDGLLQPKSSVEELLAKDKVSSCRHYCTSFE
jgi:hypothetical protein